jgi:predicted nuclease of predicted toxin-antitoxin system
LDLSQLRGHPPKVILLRGGNITTNEIEDLLRQKYSTIEFFISPDYDYGCIEIYS